MEEIEEINLNNKLINRWIPVRITTFFGPNLKIPVKKIDTLKNGLWLLYIKKWYSIPPNLRLAVEPKLLQQTEKESEYIIVETEVLARLTIRESKIPFSDPGKVVSIETIRESKIPFSEPEKILGVETVRESKIKFSDPKKVLNIELIKGSGTVNPKYHLVIFRISGKRTHAGSYKLLQCTNGCEKIIWGALEVSGGGTHWIYTLVILVKRGEKTELEYKYRKEGTKYVIVDFNGVHIK